MEKLVRNVGLIATLLSLAVLVNNVAYCVSRGSLLPLHPSVLVSVFVAVVSATTLFSPITWARRVQVGLFTVLGFAVLFFSYDNQEFLAIFIFMVDFGLIYRYGMLNRAGVRVPIFLFSVILGIVVSSTMAGNMVRGVNLTVFLATATLFTYFLFGDEIRRLSRKIETLEPWAMIGHSAAMVAHSTKASLSVVSSIVEASNIEDETKGLLELARKDLADRLGYLQRYAAISMAEGTQQFDATELVEAAAFLFSRHPEYMAHSKLQFRGLPCVLKTHRFNFKMLVENLIKNALEAIPGGIHGLVKVEIDQQRLVVEDNGLGIRSCLPCRDARCGSCERFRIGKTTKRGGSGFGMIQIQEMVRANDWRLHIESSVNGTVITVHFKK